MFCCINQHFKGVEASKTRLAEIKKAVEELLLNYVLTILRVQKQARQGSQGIAELIDLFGHQGRKTEAETKYCEAYTHLKIIHP